MFKVDYSSNESMEFGLLDQGNYEMIIVRSKEEVTPNNKESLSLQLVVRNDLDEALPETNGKFKNRIIFDNHWKRMVDGRYVYDMKNLMYVLEAARIPEGTEIKNMEQLHGLLEGKAVKVYVKQEHSDYRGEDENTIAPWGYAKSDYPNSQHTFKKGDNKPAPSTDDGFAPSADISDDDLPF